MTTYEKNRERNLENKSAPSYVIRETCITGKKFILAGLIRWLPILVALIVGTDNMSFLAYTFVYYIFEVFLVFTFGGNGFAHFLLGIRYVDTSTFELYKRGEYYDYYWDSWFDRYKLDDSYESWYKIFSSTFQTPVMEKYHIMLCDKRAYKMFKKDYFANGRLKPEFIKKPKKDDGSILGVSSKKIFSEHEE